MGEKCAPVYRMTTMNWPKSMKPLKAEKKDRMVTSLDGKRSITVEEFDRLFEEGSDEIDQFVDWSKGKTITPKLSESAKARIEKKNRSL